MKDFALTDEGDLEIGKDVEFVSGFDAVLQRLRIRFKTFLGEWFFDVRAGLPYLQSILVRNPDLTEIENVFRAEINDTPGVVGIESLSLDYSPGPRTLGLTFRAVVEDETNEARATSDVRTTIGLDGGESLLTFTYDPFIGA